MQKQSFTLGNVHCSACEAKITDTLLALPGVEEVHINLDNKSMQVMFNEEIMGVASIVSHVQQAGYEATPSRFIQEHANITLVKQEDTHHPPPTPPVHNQTQNLESTEQAESPRRTELLPGTNNNTVTTPFLQSMQEQGFMLNKVHCASCQSKIHAAVMELEGIVRASVDTLRKSVVITFNKQKTNIESIEQHFADTKYAMKPVDNSAFMPLIPHISTVKQRKIPQNKEKSLPNLQNLEQTATPAVNTASEKKNENNVNESHSESHGESHDEQQQTEQTTLLNNNASLLSSPISNITLVEPPTHTTSNFQPQESVEHKNSSEVADENSVSESSSENCSESHKEQQQTEQATLLNDDASLLSSPISNITLVEPPTYTLAQQLKNTQYQRQNFSIGNVHCTACEAKVVKLLTALDGIEKVNVNVLRKTMLISFDNKKIQTGYIVQNMEKAGYTATPIKTAVDLGTEQKNLIPLVHTAGDFRPQESVEHKNSAVSERKKKIAPSFWSNWPLSLIFSLFFAGTLMYIAMAPMFALPLPTVLDIDSAPFNWACAQALLTLPILLINQRIFVSGFRGIISASPNMDSLVGLGSATAALFGLYALWRIFDAHTVGDAANLNHFVGNLYFDSAGMILALIGLGKFFEHKARERTGSAIDALMRLSPPTATVLRNGEEVTIASEEVNKGDILVIHAGQSLAADGVITQGEAFIDTSPITGESLPQKKRVGDSVIGATICQSGYFQMQVTSAGEQSVLAQIIELVETATASKAPIAKLADRISAIFVPIIIGIAVLSFASWMLLGASLEFALSIAISVLVISCPCALGLATPTAIMVGMGMGAEHGILFKSAAAIERMQNINTVVLDKTGTLTHGKPVVTDIIPITENFDSNTVNNEKLSPKQIELLSTAASIEKLSEHPLGQAIVQKARECNLELIPSDKLNNFNQMPGLGISATHDDAHLLAGNARLLAKENILNLLLDKEKELARLGKTVLYFARANSLLGIISVADTVKESSRTAVRDLKNLGLNVLMLTGDNALTAKAVQEQVDIENIFAEVLPQEKEEKVRELQEAGHKVIMVGDGINDAPALARAHVGIAIGKGTDIALQSSDIVLMQSDVAHVSGALKLSKAVMRTIKQNLFWAFAYNSLLIPVAAGVFYGLFGLTLNPMLAAASMSLSSLTVVGNALRLRMQSSKIF